jgi:flavin-dependent dehydrogenase
MTKTFNAIVVGARCAGSTTAMLLARAGYRVLVVDRATSSFLARFLATKKLWTGLRG